jgi:predicted transposase/invertase (TIGR01784 family)
MPNQFDRIFKENIEPLFHFFAAREGVKIEKSEEIKDKIQATVEREADFVRKIIAAKKKANSILQLEFQLKAGRRLPHRLLLYRALLYHEHDLPVKQIVIFLASKPIKMKNFIEQENLYLGFHVVNVCEIPYHEFIKSNAPQAIVMAILGDTENQTPDKIVDDVLTALRENAIDQDELNKYLTQLQILSNLRNLQSKVYKKIKAMPIKVDLSKDPMFIDIKEEGKKEGLQEGRIEGLQEGIELATINFVRNLLNANLSTIPQIASIANTSVDFVLKVKKEMESEKKGGQK